MRALSLDGTVICSLTAMTGRQASSERRVLIPYIKAEANARTLSIGFLALPFGLMTAYIAYAVIGSVFASLLFVPIVEAVAFFLFQRRSRSGLRLRTYQALLDERKHKANVITMCGVPVDPIRSAPILVASAAVLVPRDPAGQIDDLFDMPSPRNGNPAGPPARRKTKKKMDKRQQDVLDDVFGQRRS